MDMVELDEQTVDGTEEPMDAIKTESGEEAPTLFLTYAHGLCEGFADDGTRLFEFEGEADIIAALASRKREREINGHFPRGYKVVVLPFDDLPAPVWTKHLLHTYVPSHLRELTRDDFENYLGPIRTPGDEQFFSEAVEWVAARPR